MCCDLNNCNTYALPGISGLSNVVNVTHIPSSKGSIISYAASVTGLMFGINILFNKVSSINTVCDHNY